MFCFAKQKLLITSDNNEYPVTAFIQKPPPKFFFRYATEKLRILVTLCRNRSLPPSLRYGGHSLLFGIMASEIIPVTLSRSLTLATSHNTEYAKLPFSFSPFGMKILRQLRLFRSHYMKYAFLFTANA